MSTTTRAASSPFLSTFPGHYYYDPAVYQQEQERLFSRMWVYAGVASVLSEPGDYKVVPIANESVIVVRTKQGELRAFYNVCRHRGARLCSATGGHLKGAIQCRYHAWTYGLDGQLIGAPNVLNLDDFDRASFGLFPVALQTWQGLIWLNISDTPPSLAGQISDPAVEIFAGNGPIAHYNIANLQVAETITYDVQANWKLIMENTLECYHCGPMHPELCALLPQYRTGLIDDNTGATFAPGIEAFTITGKASRPPLPGLQPADLRSYYGFFAMPNTFINLLPDHVVIDHLQPLSPTSTRVTSQWLFDPTIMSQPDFNPIDAVSILDLVNRQDWVVCELAQQGVTSKVFAHGGNYAPLEHHIRHFINYILAKLA